MLEEYKIIEILQVSVSITTSFDNHSLYCSILNLFFMHSVFNDVTLVYFWRYLFTFAFLASFDMNFLPSFAKNLFAFFLFFFLKLTVLLTKLDGFSENKKWNLPLQLKWLKDESYLHELWFCLVHTKTKQTMFSNLVANV